MADKLVRGICQQSALQERVRVGMFRLREGFVTWPTFDDLTGIHDEHPVGGRQRLGIMTDQQERGTVQVS